MPQTRERRRAWLAENRDREQRRIAAWRTANPDRVWEYEQTRNAAHPERRLERGQDSQAVGYRRGHFVAIDGEGFTHHREGCSGQRDERCRCPQDYVLMMAWDAEPGTTPMVLRNPDWSRLTTEQVFAWLREMKARYMPAKFVGFGLSYDFWMWLRDFSPPDIWRVGETNKTVWSRNDCWAVDYLPKRRIRVKHGRRRRDVGWESDDVVSIDDMLTFFNTSFQSVIREWLGDVPSVIRKGKQARAEFALASFQSGEVERYTTEELRLTCELAKLIKQAKADIGLGDDTEMRGSGALAGAFHEMHGTNELFDGPTPFPDPELEDFVRRTFFGGRIETLAFGSYNGLVYDYDINSAYPAAMVECLPNLSQGCWIQSTDLNAPTHVAFYKVKALFGDVEDSKFYPFSIRVHDRIFRPRHGTFYVTKDEFDAMREAGGYPDRCWKVLDGWVWIPDANADLHPFCWVRDLFEQRARFREHGNDGAARMVKIVTNTLYGKLCQDVGGFRDPRTGVWHLPKFQNLIFASLITGYVRALVYRMAMKSPAHLLSFSTDGLTFNKRIPVELSDELGGIKDDIKCEFEDERGNRCDQKFHEADAIQLLMNGIYRLQLPCGHWLERGRGFAERKVDWQAINAGWRDRQEHIVVTGKARMVNPYECLVRNNIYDIHRWRREHRDVRQRSFDLTAWDAYRYVWMVPRLELNIRSAGNSRQNRGDTAPLDPSVSLCWTWPNDGAGVGLMLESEGEPRTMRSERDMPYEDDYEEFDPTQEFAEPETSPIVRRLRRTSPSNVVSEAASAPRSHAEDVST